MKIVFEISTENVLEQTKIEKAMKTIPSRSGFSIYSNSGSSFSWNPPTSKFFASPEKELNTLLSYLKIFGDSLEIQNIEFHIDLVIDDNIEKTLEELKTLGGFEGQTAFTLTYGHISLYHHSMEAHITTILPDTEDIRFMFEFTELKKHFGEIKPATLCYRSFWDFVCRVTKGDMDKIASGQRNLNFVCNRLFEKFESLIMKVPVHAEAGLV